VHFPPIDELVKWPSISESFFFNKIALVNVLAVLLTVLFFVLANKRQLVPRGAQNLGESAVNFINEGIVQQTIGHGGEKYIPYLATIFFFVFFNNIFEVVPVIAMPANARMGAPAFMAIVTWLFFIAVGLKHQGPKYFWNAIFVPGIPAALHILMIPVEFISTFIVRPFSLAVRLFANMLAGHILLVTFAVLTLALLGGGVLGAVVGIALPFPLLVALTAFEVVVAFLQAYVFTILAAVYIGGAAHPEH
jgi:F-type H+-transporting ATPase subunit a